MLYETNSLGVTSLKWKREERRFVGLKIILILHCGNEFLKQVLNFRPKLMTSFRDVITKSSFLDIVGITFFRT